jgi:hypothetical protein
MSASICTPWVFEPCCADIDLNAADPVLVANARQAAIDFIYESTGRRFNGDCTDSFMPPCLCGCFPCACEWRVMDLRNYISHAQEHLRNIEITVDGVAVPAAGNWEFTDGRWLTPLRGGLLDPWPRQNLNAVAGTPGTWSIAYTYGTHPPQLALLAAADVMCEILRACLDMPCDVPRNAVAVTRDGVTVKLAPGFGGLPSVMALRKAYPRRRRLPSRIYQLGALSRTRTPL